MKYANRYLFILAFLFAVNLEVFAQSEQCKKEGEIIEFEASKCGMCWGWIIAIGQDTVKSGKINSRVFGYDFKNPMPVHITVGKLISKITNDYPYYEILCIEKK